MPNSIQAFEYYKDFTAPMDCDFAMLMDGNGMTGARIYDGDVVFFRQQDTVNDGEIAAVLIGDKTTIGRVRYFPNGRVILCPDNSDYSPIVVSGPDETSTFRIIGKAVAAQLRL